jgi:hypothetical protein
VSATGWERAEPSAAPEGRRLFWLLKENKLSGAPPQLSLVVRLRLALRTVRGPVITERGTEIEEDAPSRTELVGVAVESEKLDRRLLHCGLAGRSE